MSVRETGTINPKFPKALPIAFDLSKEKAEGIVTLVGRQLWDGEYVWSIRLPSSPPNSIKEWFGDDEFLAMKLMNEAHDWLIDQGIVEGRKWTTRQTG